MNEDMKVWLDTITGSFTETEIDCLENLSEWVAEQQEKGHEVVLPETLLLDEIANYREVEGDA